MRAKPVRIAFDWSRHYVMHQADSDVCAIEILWRSANIWDGVFPLPRPLRLRILSTRHRPPATLVCPQRLFCSLLPTLHFLQHICLYTFGQSSAYFLTRFHAEIFIASFNYSLIMTAGSTVNPTEVGWQFVPQYYTFVHDHPNRLHCFYTKASTLTHGTEGEDVKACYGQQVCFYFSHCKVISLW